MAGLSYVHGASSPPLIGETIGGLFDETCGACGSAGADRAASGDALDLCRAEARRGLSSEAVKDFCRGEIAHYKIPRHIKFVEGFPITVTGKVQKFAMREAMIAELDLMPQKTA